MPLSTPWSPLRVGVATSFARREDGLLGALGTLGAVDVGKILAHADHPEQLVQKVTIRSAWLPSLVVDKPFEGESRLQPLLRFLQPRIDVEVDGLTPAVTWAPAGTPTEHWPVVAGVGAVVGGIILLLAGYGAWRLFRG